MRTLLIIITASILCLSCGKKDKPEYKSQGRYNKIIYLI
jgi:hypothetical protein